MSAPWTEKCPRCDGRDVLPEEGQAETFDGVLLTTHICCNPVCRARFRVTPPDAVWMFFPKARGPADEPWQSTEAAC